MGLSPPREYIDTNIMGGDKPTPLPLTPTENLGKGNEVVVVKQFSACVSRVIAADAVKFFSAQAFRVVAVLAVKQFFACVSRVIAAGAVKFFSAQAFRVVAVLAVKQFSACVSRVIAAGVVKFFSA